MVSGDQDRGVRLATGTVEQLDVRRGDAPGYRRVCSPVGSCAQRAEKVGDGSFGGFEVEVGPRCIGCRVASRLLPVHG